MKAFATLIDEIEQELQDSSNAIWSAAELGIQLEDAIREISDYKPYAMEYTYKLESRTGTATSTTADALVDATETQFLSTDTDKVVYNTYDNTWAIVTAYVSTSQLTLSKDIMASTEGYEIYNTGCRNKYQINIEGITDYVGPAPHGVIAVEYKGTKRNFKVEGDILTIDVDSVSDSKIATPATDVEVHVLVEARQRVSQLTTLTGAIDLGAGYAAGLAAIHVDTLQTTGTFGEDTLFTIAGVRGTYRVTANATIASSECDLTIHPALIDAASDGDVVTIKGSTLDSRLERLVVELATARAGMSKTINAVNIGGTGTFRDFRDKLAIVLGELERMRRGQMPRSKHVYPKD